MLRRVPDSLATLRAIGRRLAKLMACGVVGVNCACGAARPTRNPEQSPVHLHRGPITDFVPAAGLRWMIVARPLEILVDPTLQRGLERFFPKERLDLFAEQSGIDLRTLSAGCIAGFDIGTLYLAETTAAVRRAEVAFTKRLVSEPVIARPGPGVVRVTGIIGVTPESFVGLEGRLVGISVKDPSLTKIVGGFALERLKKSPSSLAGAALSTLPATLAHEPLQFYAPGPFAEEWSKGAHGLLSDTVAIGMGARIREPGMVDIVVVLEGDYGNDAPNTVARGRSTFQDLAESELGHLLALRDPHILPEITASMTRITLRVRLPLARLLDGLYVAVAADVRHILGGSPR